jgi:hypothetical protein
VVCPRFPRSPFSPFRPSSAHWVYLSQAIDDAVSPVAGSSRGASPTTARGPAI